MPENTTASIDKDITVERFEARGRSYYDGLTLLSRYLPEEEWKKEDKDYTRCRGNLENEAKKYHDEYRKQLKDDTTLSFEKGKKYFDKLLEAYTRLLSDYTKLPQPYQELCQAERCAVWLAGFEPVITPVNVKGYYPRKKEAKLCTPIQCETPVDNSVGCQGRWRSFIDRHLLMLLVVKNIPSAQEYKQICSKTPPLWFKCVCEGEEGQYFILFYWSLLLAVQGEHCVQWIEKEIGKFLEKSIDDDFFLELQRFLSRLVDGLDKELSAEQIPSSERSDKTILLLEKGYRCKRFLEKEYHSLLTGPRKEVLWTIEWLWEILLSKNKNMPDREIFFENNSKENSSPIISSVQTYESIVREYKKIFSKEPPPWFESLPEIDKTVLMQQGQKISDEGLDEGLPIPPIVREYGRIFNEPPPLWLQRPKWRQEFIKSKGEGLVLSRTIPSALRWVPGPANASRHRFSINDQVVLDYFRSTTIVPIDLLVMDQGNTQQHSGIANEVFRIGCVNLAQQIMVSLEQQFSAQAIGMSVSNGHTPKEVVILMQSLLSPGWIASLKGQYFTDASDNDTQIYRIQEQIIALFQRALDDPESRINEVDGHIKSIFFTENERAEPLYYRNFLEELGFTAQGKTVIYESRPVKITLLSTNHPLNFLRYFGSDPQQIKYNEENTARLLGAVANYLEQNIYEWFPNILNNSTCSNEKALLRALRQCAAEKTVARSSRVLVKTLQFLLSDEGKKDKEWARDQDLGPYPDVVCLLTALQVLLTTPLNTTAVLFNPYHPQWLVSCAEAIVVTSIKGTLWLSCKSGKDRTAGLSAGLDAAMLYYYYADTLPKVPSNQDEKCSMEVYTEMVSNLLNSGHHQQFAAQSAPGSEGLIRSEWFCPSGVKLSADNTQWGLLNKPRRTWANKRRLQAQLNKLWALLQKAIDKLKVLWLQLSRKFGSTGLGDQDRFKDPQGPFADLDPLILKPDKWKDDPIVSPRHLEKEYHRPASPFGKDITPLANSAEDNENQPLSEKKACSPGIG